MAALDISVATNGVVDAWTNRLDAAYPDLIARSAEGLNLPWEGIPRKEKAH
jgi:hypothetical protein